MRLRPLGWTVLTVTAFSQPKSSGIFVVLPAGARAYVERSQAPLAQWLTTEKVEYQRFTISNRVYIPKPSAALADQLRQAGYTVEAEKVYELPPPIDRREVVAPQAIEPGVMMVRAPELWARGLDGSGTLIAVIDTGFDAGHPALAARWRGATGGLAGNWRDPANVCKGKPCDNNGHGSHVTGTVLGSDGANQIGVAPKAQFIACKGCESSSCSGSSLLTCSEWVLAPYQDGTGRGRPHIVSNSWGGGGRDPWFADAVAAWRAAGILPIFAAGNTGPDCGTVGSPGEYQGSLAVGAVARDGTIAPFSSRGPSLVDGGLKPNVSAPGVNVTSAKPGGGYVAMSGTSMATPHVAGVAALLWAGVGRRHDSIWAALQDGARPQPTAECGEDSRVPNNVYGYGIVDAVAALEKLVPARPPPPLPPPLPPPANEPPKLAILEPAEGTGFPCGVPVKFRGQATDREEGDLSASIVWWDRYPFWRGSSAEATGMTGAGCNHEWHLVVAEVTDSAGARAEAQVRVKIVR